MLNTLLKTELYRFKRTFFWNGGTTLVERQRCAIEKWQ
jgi:hypothetical protein